MATPVLKKLIKCGTAPYTGTLQFSFDAYLSPGWICEAVDAAPTNFYEITDVDGNLVAYNFIGASAGSYEIMIQAANYGGTYSQWLLQFELGTECATEEDIECCDDRVDIRWLGREGGIKQWTFPGVREFDIKVGDAITFKNTSRQVQYAQRKDIYTGKRISTGYITQEQFDYLDELRYCIQAWEVDSSVIPNVFTPILIDNDSFFKYKTTDKFYEVKLQYILAEEIQVQTQ